MGALSAYRRRFDGGGAVDPADPAYLDETTGFNQPDPQAAPPQGALQAARPLTKGEVVNKAQQGASALHKAVQLQQVNATLAASGAAPPGGMLPMVANDQGGPPPQQMQQQQSGSIWDGSAFGPTNLPMLAAAAAMLKPTHTGGFSEALGNAFAAAGPVAEQERTRAENARLRKAQMDNTNAIWQGRLGVQNRNADTREMSAEALSDMRDAQAELARARAAGLPVTQELQQRAMGIREGRNDIMQDRNDISRDRNGVLSDQGQQRIDQGQARIEQSAQRLQNTEEYRAKVLELRARGMDDASINNTMTNAARLSAMDPRLPVGKAADQVLSARGTVQGRRQSAGGQGQAPSGGGDPLAAARAAIARGAPRDAVIQRLQQNGINPGGL